ncbi:MAG TPA: hypothetical protein VGG07_24975 [Solirubrobacteraceae bacterium]
MTKQDGLRLREKRRARVRRIRARVIGGSIALFLAVWMLITVVLVTGHDPALARKTATHAATPATTTSSSSSSTGSGATSSSTGSTSSGATSSSTGSGSGGVSSVTSSQS